MNPASILLALTAGAISITSPCCLPLLPGYLGYLSGVSPNETEGRRGRTAAAALLFVAGFSVVFVALGATASVIGGLLLVNRAPLAQLSGVFILAMGIFILLEGRIPAFGRSGTWAQRWAHGQLWAAAPLGAAFAITWTPCIGPVLGAILTLAGSTGDVGQGVVLLAAYSLGLGIPFVALGLSVNRVRRLLRKMARGMAVMQTVSGGLLATMGILLLTNNWLPLIAPVLAWYARLRWPPI